MCRKNLKEKQHNNTNAILYIKICFKNAKKNPIEFLKARHKHHNNSIEGLKRNVKFKKAPFMKVVNSHSSSIIFGFEVKITEDFTN